MPKAVEIDDFAGKLDLLCKRLNWSRAKLAQQVGIDKSLASRWLSGTSRPTGNSLMRLNEAIAKALPGFGADSWDMATGALASRIGVAPAAGQPKPATSGLFEGLRSIERFGQDIEHLAPIFSGFYRRWSLHPTTGGVMRRHLQMWREGDTLRIQSRGLNTTYIGSAFVVARQLVAILESRSFFLPQVMVMHGAYTSSHPGRMTGYVVYEQSRGVVAIPNVIEFLEPLGRDAEAVERTWQTLLSDALDVSPAEEAALVPADVLVALRSGAGRRSDGTLDSLPTMQPLS